MLARCEPFARIHRRRGDVCRGSSCMPQDMRQFFGNVLGERRTESGERRWMPAVDVSENDDEIVLRAELPGIRPDDMELDLQDRILTLKGKKKQDRKVEQEHFLRIERSYGSFSRSFQIPAAVKVGEIEAVFNDGVLMITLPKPESAKSQKVAISDASS